MLVKEYYRLNAGFFLVIGMLTFGFMSDVEHMALAQFFISSPYLLLIPLFVWVIYLLKIMQFNTRQLSYPENLFLYHFGLLHPSMKFVFLLGVIIVQLTPALLYGAFLISVAAKFGFFFAIGEVMISLGVFMVLASARLFVEFNHPGREIKVSGVKRIFDYNFTRSIIQFYTGWIIRREPVLLLGTKIFSGLLLYGVAKLYGTDNYDWRLIGMGTTLAFSSNFMVVLQLHRFENSYFAILRNLPISAFTRLLIFLLSFLILGIPEIVLLVKYFPFTLPTYYIVLLVLLGSGFNLLFYGMLFIPGITQESFLRLTFVIVVLYILLILFNIPLVLLIVGNFMTGVSLFKRYYYSFELNASKKLPEREIS